MEERRYLSVGADGHNKGGEGMRKELENGKDRDWKLARVIYEEQCLSFGTIRDFFFNGQKSNASRRLKILREEKLIRWEKIGFSKLMRVVRLTQRGIEHYREKFPIPVKQKRKLAPATITHDLLVTETRLHLSKIYNAEWVPERALKSLPLKKIPDGILTFPSGKRIAVEVENTTKSKDRYEAIWREWENQNFMLILYVSTQDSVHRALVKNMKEFKSLSLRLGLMKFKDFKNQNLTHVWTPSSELPLFSKREF